jgi:hypothetical protein
MNPRLLVALRGDLEKIMKQEVSAAERAITLGVRETTDHLKTELRDQVTGAGLGKKLAFTWRGKTFPQGRMSINAAGFVWSNAPQIISAFDMGAIIRSRTGAYLPVPLPAAGKLAGRKKLTPKNWEQHNNQKLVFVKRKGGNNPILIAENMRARKGKRGGFTKAKTNKGLTTVPMFVLIPQVSLKKRLDVKSAVAKWSNNLEPLVIENWKEPSDT